MATNARAALLAALLASTGCASVPMMPEADDLAGKAFTQPPADRAHLYVYRNERLGSALTFGLDLDGYQVASTGPKTYVLLPVAPGKHVVTSHAENKDQLELTLEGGRRYYVWQEVKMGFLQARTRLHQLDEAAGQAGVRECQRAVVAPPPGSEAAPPAPPAVPAI